jgi:cytochrome c peroxidase
VNFFAKAYPTVALADLNIGHLGRALGAFMKIKFKSNNAAVDQYLAGDLQALSESQKRGMLVFYGRGQCVRCHSGANFTDERFHTSGVPQIGFVPFVDDLGKAGDTGLAVDRYRFKTPSLRNISLTAPYMHDGAFETLEAVVHHYNDIAASLSSYRMPASYQAHYEMQLITDTSSARNTARLNQVDNRALRNGLNLSVQEQTDLVDFLKNGLRDLNFN